MSEYKIEKGVPMPERGVRSIRYPFEQMEVGDSFTYLAAEDALVRSAAHRNTKATGKRFAVRKLSASGGRCWRVS